MNYVDVIEKRIEGELENNKEQSIAHDLGHHQRVRTTAVEIAKNYPGVDLEVLEISSLLHDINQPRYLKEEHVEKSVEVAGKILDEIGYKKKELVLSIITEHSTESLRGKSSQESKILFDADKIDGVGYIGIARVFAYCGQLGMDIKETIKWYREKIDLSLRNLQTKEGKEMFQERLRPVEGFLEAIEKDIG